MWMSLESRKRRCKHSYQSLVRHSKCTTLRFLNWNLQPQDYFQFSCSIINRNTDLSFLLSRASDFLRLKEINFFRIFFIVFLFHEILFLTTLFELGCINWFFILTLDHCLEIEPSKWKANSNHDYFDRVYSCMKPELNCYSWVFIALLLLWFLAPWLATASVISLHSFKNCPALPCSHHLGRKLGWKRREIAHFTR